MLGALFHEVLYRPLFNALIALYTFLPGQDIGLAVIVLTVLLRLLLTPLLRRQFHSTRVMSTLQPQLAEIRRATKDRQEQSRRMLKLYQQHGVNPAGGCLPLLVQLPILWAMYAVLRAGLSPDVLNGLYPFLKNPGTIHPVAFGFLDLARVPVERTSEAMTIVWPGVALALLTGAVTYWQAKIMPSPTPHSASEDATPAEQAMHRMSRQMLLIMPVMIVWWGLFLPVGLSLYWFISTLFSVVQQKILLKGALPLATAAAPREKKTDRVILKESPRDL